jgi:hypothetical protein
MKNDDDKSQSIEGHEHDAIGFIQNNRRKTYKNNNRTTKSFQWKFIIGCVLIESYFMYNFTNSRYLLNNMQDLMQEMNSTSITKAWYARTFNMLRWIIIDPSLTMSRQASQDLIG